MSRFSSEVDLDRLADFVGGALDGTPDADAVRHLVSTDTAWAEAYAALVTADATMRDELGALGSEPLEMPDDVLHRLEAALRAEAAGSRAGAVVDLGRARVERRQRWALGLAAAAALLVCGGAGVTVLRSAQNDRTTTASEAPGAAQDNAAAPSVVVAPTGPAEVVVSGNDYTPETLSQAGAQAPRSPAAAAEGNSGSGKRNSLRAADVPDPLRRLSDPNARAVCLDAIVREYGGQVAQVEFARFEGTPALVVVVDGARAAAGRRWVVVVGPDCGLGGAISDERYHAAV